jgi:hypothetical protein
MALSFLNGQATSRNSRFRAYVVRVRRDTAVKSRRFKAALGIPGLLAVTAIVFAELLGTEAQLLLNTHHEVLGTLGAMAGLMMFLAYRWVSQLPDAVGAHAYGNEGTGKLPQRRGLVLLVGLDSAKPSSAAAQLLSKLPNLEYVAYMGTTGTAEHGVVSALADKIAPAAGVNLAPGHERRWEFAHAESVAQNEQGVTEAILWMIGRGLDPSEIIVDTSAGRRAMAYGAKDAADEHHVETQYLAPAWDTAANVPIAGTERFKIIREYYFD